MILDAIFVKAVSGIEIEVNGSSEAHHQLSARPSSIQDGGGGGGGGGGAPAAGRGCTAACRR